VADYERWYDWLAARQDVDPERIVFHGRSLGTGVVSGLARTRRSAAVVLESPFTSIAAMSARYGVPSFLVRHPFRSDEALSALTCGLKEPARELPVLILHSPDDEIVPYSHGTKLRDRVCGARLVDL
jgi:fermentation-respiration switch protein FrsA (DUF1100 family)